MITLNNIKKSFPMPESELVVLDNLSLEVNKGKILSITGSSGSGKSTLLHIIGGLDKPTDGEVLFDGQNIYELNSTDIDSYRNTHVGFIFQFHYLLDDFNALENVSIPALIAGKSKAEAQEAAKELLNMVGLSDRMNHHPKELSGGEQQRVSVARALMNKPSLILADEPTGNLDKANSDIVKNLLFSLKSMDTAIVIVTHDLDMARECDEMLQLQKV